MFLQRVVRDLYMEARVWLVVQQALVSVQNKKDILRTFLTAGSSLKEIRKYC
jgi:hypothetical protein